MKTTDFKAVEEKERRRRSGEHRSDQQHERAPPDAPSPGAAPPTKGTDKNI